MSATEKIIEIKDELKKDQRTLALVEKIECLTIEHCKDIILEILGVDKEIQKSRNYDKEDLVTITNLTLKRIMKLDY